MLIGDGGRNKNNIMIHHSMKQESYALFKRELLTDITNVKVNMRYFEGKYPSLRLEPRLIPLTKSLVNELYSSGKKKLTQQFLNYLSVESIAIWYMDDGSKSLKKRKGKVHAAEVTLNTYLCVEENNLIIDYFKENWGICWQLNKSKNSYRLRMGTREARKFFTIINPYIHNSMNYKTTLW